MLSRRIKLNVDQWVTWPSAAIPNSVESRDFVCCHEQPQSVTWVNLVTHESFHRSRGVKMIHVSIRVFVLFSKQTQPSYHYKWFNDSLHIYMVGLLVWLFFVCVCVVFFFVSAVSVTPGTSISQEETLLVLERSEFQSPLLFRHIHQHRVSSGPFFPLRRLLGCCYFLSNMQIVAEGRKRVKKKKMFWRLYGNFREWK